MPRVVDYERNEHWHICINCLTVWSHRACQLPDKPGAYASAHVCPECDSGPFYLACYDFAKTLEQAAKLAKFSIADRIIAYGDALVRARAHEPPQ